MPWAVGSVQGSQGAAAVHGVCSALSSFKPSCRSWGGLGQPRAPIWGWFQAQQRTFVAAWSQGGKEGGRMQCWQWQQGRGRAWDLPPAHSCPFLVPKGNFDCCTKPLECSALCLLTLGWDCCSLHTSRGKLCQHLSLCSFFSPLIFFSISCPELGVLELLHSGVLMIHPC